MIGCHFENHYLLFFAIKPEKNISNTKWLQFLFFCKSDRLINKNNK